MSGYNLIMLKNMIKELGEEDTKKELSSFSCPINHDVENFLRDKAIEFEKQSYSSTHLVYASYKNEQQLVGYFTLADKHFRISAKPKHRHGKGLSNTQRRKITKHGTYNSELDIHTIPAPLIAQLGRNFASGDGSTRLITGDELLKIACDKVWEAKRQFSGRFVYLECEDKQLLVDFYESNGFVAFGTRPLDSDEKDDLSGNYLVQMLKDLYSHYEK